MAGELLASNATELLTGANLPFVAAFVLGLLFTALSVLGVGQSDASADAGDADTGVGADADHAVDVEAGHDVELGDTLGVGAGHDFAVGDTPGVEIGHDVGLGDAPGVEIGHELAVGEAAGVDGALGAAGAHGVGADFHHEVEFGTDHNGPHGAGGGAGGAAGGAGGWSISLSDVLYFFGIGKVPLSMLLMAFCYAFAVAGWAANTLSAGPNGSAPFALSLLAGLVAGLALMRVVSGVVGHVLPTKNVSGFSRRQLVGLRGVVGLPVSGQSGRAQVLDPEGTLHQVRCRTAPGGRPLAKGTAIRLVKYLAEDDVYYVAADRQR